MWIDTHCHLDYLGTVADIDYHLEQASMKGVRACIVPAVQRADFARIQSLAQRHPAVFYTLGIHPLYVLEAKNEDISYLSALVQEAQYDPKCVGVGEIGLDGFEPRLQTVEARTRQIDFFTQQLRIAQQYQLPVILHVRKQVDLITKYIRSTPVIGGVCHAFNGSMQQAQQCIQLGLALGAGGAMTYTRALQIRRLVQNVPLEAWVIETDAPDIPPAWLSNGQPNSLQQVAKIGETFAELRGLTVSEAMQALYENTLRRFPKLAIHPLFGIN